MAAEVVEVAANAGWPAAIRAPAAVIVPRTWRRERVGMVGLLRKIRRIELSRVAGGARWKQKNPPVGGFLWRYLMER
ncbi:hypothetical protein HHA04nite_14000 [Halomonas halophila]|uniref:Uncharacterized protein n=1 Tax=Halomonas halophila TaxID=29573 RepID=A0ABQ0U2T8_9GAMM|nr:hypothetical protein HHA04nite_14000 [Halomonas halophila]